MFTLCNINYFKNYLKTLLQYRLNKAMTSAAILLFSCGDEVMFADTEIIYTVMYSRDVKFLQYLG